MRRQAVEFRPAVPAGAQLFLLGPGTSPKASKSASGQQLRLESAAPRAPVTSLGRKREELRGNTSSGRSVASQDHPFPELKRGRGPGNALVWKAAF